MGWGGVAGGKFTDRSKRDLKNFIKAGPGIPGADSSG